ncbi:MAG: hypothetical protein LBL47_01035 [Lactobacillus sp.]|jgi:hypothetical protein|nr:hypothetical protein [Lactobacillus sp.]
MKSFYLGKSAREIEEIENRYNYIPIETNAAAADVALNSICLKTVKDITVLRHKNMETKTLETILKKYRDYAVKAY